jgi:hypothetical protein
VEFVFVEYVYEIWYTEVSILYREGLLMTVSKELKYKLDSVGVQEVQWVEVTLIQQKNIHVAVEREMRIMN